MCTRQILQMQYFRECVFISILQCIYYLPQLKMLHNKNYILALNVDEVNENPLQITLIDRQVPVHVLVYN